MSLGTIPLLYEARTWIIQREFHMLALVLEVWYILPPTRIGLLVKN